MLPSSVALIALNGVFAMSELAIVSSRKPRLEAMARKGTGGARVALDLAADPGKLLSTAQIGITLIGILAGAYSGASLGGPTGERLELLGAPHDAAYNLGFGLVIVVTTFVSLIIGELVPKQFALRAPEPIAAVVARPMLWLSKATAPARLAARFDQCARFPPARPEARVGRPCHGRGVAPDRWPRRPSRA